MHKYANTEKSEKMHYTMAFKTVKKLSVELWTLLTLNDHHLGSVAEGETGNIHMFFALSTTMLLSHTSISRFIGFIQQSVMISYCER